MVVKSINATLHNITLVIGTELAVMLTLHIIYSQLLLNCYSALQENVSTSKNKFGIMEILWEFVAIVEFFYIYETSVQNIANLFYKIF